MGSGIPRLRRDNHRGGNSVFPVSGHCRHRTWPHWHLCERYGQRSRHPLRAKTSYCDSYDGLDPYRRHHRLHREHVLCFGCGASDALRRCHLARLLVAHSGNGRYRRALPSRGNTGRSFHAGLCRGFCRATAGRLDPRPVRRNVTTRLGHVVFVGCDIDGRRPAHLLDDLAARACWRQGRDYVRMASVQKDPNKRRRVDPLVVAVNALGITQITAWGTSFYCLGVLAKPIVADTGWPLTTVFLGFTVALLVMGFISTWVGRLIDRAGARVVMCVGTIILSAGLAALSQVRDPASYLVVWAIVGIGMRCCLYDAAFAALVQITPRRGRKAISYLTLYGAYASTVFWVIGYYLNEAYGWRGTLIAFAAINLFATQLAWSRAPRPGGSHDPGDDSNSFARRTPAPR